jgi:hypothetical protein
LNTFGRRALRKSKAPRVQLFGSVRAAQSSSGSIAIVQ